MYMGVKNIVYSHSDYFDVLEIFLETQKRFAIDNIVIFSDKEFNKTNTHILYDPSKSYSERLRECLKQLDDDIILYQHEDMFLYQDPSRRKMSEYIKTLKDTDYSFVRLCRTGNCGLLKLKDYETLYDIHPQSPDFFAVQPTLWKREKFIEFLEKSGDLSIWDLELNSGKVEHGLKGLMHFAEESSRGGHFNSKVWPYVATAIVKGKWNFKEYYFELNNIEKVRTSPRERIL